MKLNEEELSVVFGDAFTKTSGRCVVAEKSPEQHQDNAVLEPQLLEWNVFESFDPINDSMSSSSPLLRKRVDFATNENGDILCMEYSCVKTRQDVRATWYGASDFQQFRAWCHETTANAVMDMDYSEYFHMMYSACCRSGTSSLPDVDEDDASEFAHYRGLERVIFRKQLQTDKIAAIQGVVWTQNDALVVVNEDMLADTSRTLTKSARNMAQYLAAADALVAQQAKPNGKPHRFAEI